MFKKTEIEVINFISINNVAGGGHVVVPDIPEDS